MSLLTGTLGPSDNTKESVFCSTAEGKYDKPKAANILHQMAAARGDEDPAEAPVIASVTGVPRRSWNSGTLIR